MQQVLVTVPEIVSQKEENERKDLYVWKYNWKSFLCASDPIGVFQFPGILEMMEYRGNRQSLYVICSCSSSLPQTLPRHTAVALITHNTNAWTPETRRLKVSDEGRGGGELEKYRWESGKEEVHKCGVNPLISLWAFAELPLSWYRFKTKFQVWGWGTASYIQIASSGVGFFVNVSHHIVTVWY